MKKMTKGAIVTGLGVALLLGGGGTLAVWNQEATSSPGTVIAGDLNLEATQGAWTDAAGKKINIDGYRVVPGDVLTYTQDLKVTLLGENMKAVLTTSGVTPTNGFGENVTVTGPELSTGGDQLTALHNDKTVTATTVFTFHEDTTGREAVNATYDFADVSYTLTQQATTAPSAD